MCLWFTSVVLKLQGYVDADLVNDVDQKKKKVLLGLYLLWVEQLYHGLQISRRLLLCLL